MASSKCAACAKRVRKTTRAIVLTGPGKLTPGKVCAGCARKITRIRAQKLRR